MVEQFVLQLYAEMAHDCTRGSWTCFESRGIPNWTPAGGYTTPSQSIVPLNVKWMLAWEDPMDFAKVTLLKATPRSWLAAGETIAVQNSPLTAGRFSYNVTSALAGLHPTIAANIKLIPTDVMLADTRAPKIESVKLRLRVPVGWKMAAVTIGGNDWSKFDSDEEEVTVPLSDSTTTNVLVHYTK